ncbi:MAG TPA: cytochrome c oxidase subunit II [Euzebya sp.]|nr:cytochrome c oxidase subunit II [Euzebya sp.]
MRSTPLRQRMAAGRVRAFLALSALALFAAGCSTTFDGSETSAIPGPDPGRELPADALRPFGPIAEAQDELWDLTYLIAIAVFVLIFGGLGFILFAFRDKGEAELPKQVHGNTRLEITWTLIPAVILAIIAIPTVQTIFELSDEPAEDALMITVVGKQYWWQFEYEAEGFTTASELHIPTNREVFISLDGTLPEDSGEYAAEYGTDPVLHSFWVPSLAGKRDFVPGAVRTMRIQADEPGVYPGNCAEFCGLSHANMRFTVIAHDPADYEAWLTDMTTPAAEPTEPQAVEGMELAVTCLACHTIDSHPDNAGSRVGPSLSDFARREAFGGYIFDSPFGEQVEDPEGARDRLHAWITNPAGEKPGAQMPAQGVGEGSLTPEQIDAIIAYLGTLE